MILGGKSICYQIPGLYYKGLTIVISPLIALMNDQGNLSIKVVIRLKSMKISADFISSTLTYNEQDKLIKAAINGDLKILYVSPERFIQKRFIEKLMKANVCFIAIDEAHCISE